MEVDMLFLRVRDQGMARILVSLNPREGLVE